VRNGAELLAFHSDRLAERYLDKRGEAATFGKFEDTEIYSLAKEVQGLLESVTGKHYAGLGAAFTAARSQIHDEDVKAAAKAVRGLEDAWRFVCHFTEIERAEWVKTFKGYVDRATAHSRAEADVDMAPHAVSEKSKKKRRKKRSGTKPGAADSVLELADDSWADGVGGDTAPLSTVFAKSVSRTSSNTRALVPSISDEARQPPLKKSPSSAAATTATNSATMLATPAIQIYATGAKVTALKLKSRPELRGSHASIVDFDVSSGRYGIEFTGTNEQMRVMACNLKASIFA
jgi:hypothetical protein